MFDLIIRNGVVVDGTGGERRIADVAVKGGWLAKVEPNIADKGLREVDATGLVVAPGWVDIHTHYDGQVTWDDELGPSAWHGVTTLVMGNCGVGFAPVKPNKHAWLIALMEGVEDIPGSALAEGIKWQWESFPEYLDALETTPRSVDVAAQIPHGAVRAYVMGERANERLATPADIQAMAAIVEEGMRAGALGFSTSRTILHRAKDGVPVPGTWAGAEELEAIASAMGRAGHGVFELASDMAPAADEFAWMRRIARDTGVPVTFGMLQSPVQPNAWREMLKLATQANADGANLYAQIAIRPTGLVLGWESTVNPFTFQPSYQAIAHLPVKERLERLRDPEVRARVIAERPPIEGELAVLRMILAQGFDRMFRLVTANGLDYEPAPDASVAAEAKRTGKDPRAIVYDMLMENNGRGYVYLPLLNYAEFNFDHIHEMLQSDRTVLSLSDGGAHCGVVCDASFPTYLLTHWVRDRSRGGRITLEQAVKRQCHDTARLYGLHDRGTLKAGQRADINVIDLERLAIDAPEIVYDLPAGGRRLVQRARGYRHTFVAGVETFRDGKSTGAKPGKLVRGVQGGERAAAAE